MKKNQRIAVVPGSFDPITNGHLDVILRATELYDQVVVAIMINPQKNYLFTIEQRQRLAELAVANHERIRVVSSKGMLWELARDLNACAIVKGYRNAVDYAYEQEMAKYNREKNPFAETVLLKAEEQWNHVSSTLVRENLLKGLDVSAYLPKAVSEEIGKILPRLI